MNYLDCLDQVFPQAISRVIETYTCPTLFQGHTESVVSLAISSDNKHLYSASFGKIIQWCLQTGESLRILQGHVSWVNCVVLSSDNKYLYSGADDHTICQWAVGDEPVVGGNGESLRTFQGHTDYVNCLVISSDNRYLYSGSWDHTIRQWAIGNAPVAGGTGKSLRTLQGHTSSVLSLALSSDNKYLYSGSVDRTIRQWAVGNEPIGSSVETGKLLRTLQGHTDYIRSLTLSSDNKYLYSACDDHTIRQWAAGNEPVGSSPSASSGRTNGPGESLRILRGQASGVYCLSLSSDNKYLYSGSRDHTIRQWSTDDRNMSSKLFWQSPYPVTTLLCKHNDLFFSEDHNIRRIQLKAFQDGNSA